MRLSGDLRDLKAQIGPFGMVWPILSDWGGGREEFGW